MILPSNKFIIASFACILGMGLFSGCGTPGIPLPPSLELPRPVKDLRALRKGNRVYLSWTEPEVTTDRQSIRHLGKTRICRNVGPTPTADNASSATEIGWVAPSQMIASKRNKKSPLKTQKKYTDKPAFPATNLSGDYTYAVEVLNDRGRSAGLSNRAQVPGVALPTPPNDFAVQATAEGVLITWATITEPSRTSSAHYLFRIYRREENAKTDVLAGEVSLDAPARFVDHDIEWGKKYLYQAAVVTKIDGASQPEIESEDTASASVFTHDIFPPAVPSGLQAVFASEGEKGFIDLIWHPDSENDLAGYNVFRHEAGSPPVKINADLIKLPAFRDINLSPGKKYYYSVSAIDIRGNESARSEEADESVP